MKFVKAANYTEKFDREIKWIVLHTMECREAPGMASAVANWFGNKALAPKASAHFCVDDKEIVQCVAIKDVAWAAPGGNDCGVHIELAGCAAQDDIQWSDEYSTNVLKNAAVLCAELAYLWEIPIKRLALRELQAKFKGFCGHRDLTNAFMFGKGHWDPGPNFPWDRTLAMVNEQYDLIHVQSGA